jgi:hypothetical protein
MAKRSEVRKIVVVPEGLSTDQDGRYYASDYYMAALDLAKELAGDDGEIYLAPANTFGAHQPEDYFGRDYLLETGCSCRVECIGSSMKRVGYLDTLDNAKYLKHHLQETGQWPLGDISLVCNRPHLSRSALMFRKFGFSIAEVRVSTVMQHSGRRMVRRLWFYDLPMVQYFYEIAATMFNLGRFYIEKA